MFVGLTVVDPNKHIYHHLGLELVIISAMSQAEERNIVSEEVRWQDEERLMRICNSFIRVLVDEKEAKKVCNHWDRNWEEEVRSPDQLHYDRLERVADHKCNSIDNKELV